MNCRQRVRDYEPVGIAVVTLLKVASTFEPRAVIVPMQTTMIRANITAYSTAVGPSSLVRNFLNKFMIVSLSLVEMVRSFSESLRFGERQRITLTKPT